MKKIMVSLLSFLVLAGVTLAAQRSPNTHGFPVTASSAHIPAPPVPAALKQIYSNLGSGNDQYNYNNGWAIIGPNFNNEGVSDTFALAFTPKTDSHITQVHAAILYDFTGDNQVNLSIYADADGVPGTLLTGPVTVYNLPPAATCCGFAVADFPPLAVTGGTQYWLVANTPTSGPGSNFIGTWAANPKVLQQANYTPQYGWLVDNAYDEAAGAVFGTIP